MALGGTINVMAQNCGTLDVGWSFQKERNRQLLLELSPHMRENIIFRNEMGNSRNWTNGPHSGTRLICCGVIYILQSVADATAPRVLVSVSLCAFSPSLAPLFWVSRILVSSIVQLWIGRELGCECHSFLLRWKAGIKQLQKWWMQQQGARRSWLSNIKGVVGFWAAESSLLLLLQLALYFCVLQLIVDTD